MQKGVHCGRPFQFHWIMWVLLLPHRHLVALGLDFGEAVFVPGVGEGYFFVDVGAPAWVRSGTVM